MEENKLSPPPDRRGFLLKLAALVSGGLAVLVPVLSSLAMVFHPLRRKPRDLMMVRVTSLQSLPNDGRPRKFNVVADRVDAWNTYRQIPVGAVYLRRTGQDEVVALNVACPHAGCFVDFVRIDGQFRCPCHKSTFSVDGKVDDPASPSPRAMDTLEVELRNGTEVWVRFQNFQAGHKDKIPVA